uniref:Uncharacterized protein n=1 Tax=Arundo donax TaxID=35708 RepID=A0A0A9ELD2_ARUDO
MKTHKVLMLLRVILKQFSGSSSLLGLS